MVGDRAYVLQLGEGLLILDITKPAAPSLLGNYRSGSDPVALAVSGFRIYLALENGTVEILDATSPVDVEVLGSYVALEVASGLAVVGEQVFLAVGSEGLEIVDIADPAHPVQVSHAALAGYATAVAVAGDQVYVAAAEAGLQVVDVWSPSSPILRPGYDTPGSLVRVTVVDGHVYAADDSHGLLILHRAPSPAERIRVAWAASEKRVILEEAPDSRGPWTPRTLPVSQTPTENFFWGFPDEAGQYYRLRGGIEQATPLGPPVNSLASRERGPTLSSDGRTLIFFSNRRGQDDLFVTTRSSLSQPWSDPVALDEINTDGDEAFPALSADGLTLVFADTFVQASRRAGNLGGSDLWISTRPDVNSPWGSPVHMGSVLNGPYHDTTPTISGDGRTLIFASSDRPDNLQDPRRLRFDLWMATRTDPNDPMGWGPPTHLGPVINSVRNEQAPSLSRDGLTLFFASDRPSPGRPSDFCTDGRCSALNNIWMSRRESLSEPFGPPVSLGAHFMELGYLLDPCIAPDGSRLIFATSGLETDPAPSGLAELWEARLSSDPVSPLSISIIRTPVP